MQCGANTRDRKWGVSESESKREGGGVREIRIEKEREGERAT